MTIQQVLQQAAKDMKARITGGAFYGVRLEQTSDVSANGTMRQWAYLYVERSETGGEYLGIRRTLVGSGNADECYERFLEWLNKEYPVRQLAAV